MSFKKLAGKAVGGIAGATLGSLGSILGGGSGGAEMAQMSAYQQKALKEIAELPIPDIEKQKIILQTPELAGLLSAEEVGQSELSKIQLDPRSRDAQLSALRELSGLAEGGLRDEDLAAFRELRRGVSAEDQARRSSMLQEMAERGTLDSGASLAAQLAGSQQSTERMAAGADRLAMENARARREALAGMGNMASSLRQADYQQASDAAQAQDAIARFNAQQRAGAQQQNLATKQQLENIRAQTGNQQEMYNKELQQQAFQNQLQKTGLLTGQYQNLANQAQAQAQAKAQGRANMLGGLMQIGGTIGGAILGGPPGAAAGNQVATALQQSGAQSSFTPVSDDYGKKLS